MLHKKCCPSKLILSKKIREWKKVLNQALHKQKQLRKTPKTPN
jgi:hypothetical protein